MWTNRVLMCGIDILLCLWAVYLFFFYFDIFFARKRKRYITFGTNCLQSSVQMLFSIINLPNWDLAQMQIVISLVGLISVLACVYCTFFLSAKCKDTLTVLLIAIGIVLIPTFAYTALGVNWISAIFPSAGLGMQNNFLYQLINFNYLHIGGMSFWTPYTILISALIEIPVFLFLTVRTYCRHQM